MQENVPPPSLESVVVKTLSERTQLDASLVARALALLDEGWAIPYLARYRREDVGGLDEDALWNLRLEAQQLLELERRREFILQAVAEREVSEKFKRRIQRCRTRTELEYLYEPYRPPRKTPGSLAKERGLEPLADAWLGGEAADAAPYVDAAKGVATPEDAMLGAREILAERFAVDPDVRAAMLRTVEKEGVLRTAPPPGQAEIPSRYGQMRTYEERLARVPSHRFLALRRAEKEGAVTVRVEFPDAKVLAMVAQRFYPKEPAEEVKAFLDLAAGDAVRLMRPAVFEDALHRAKDRADAEAIGVFCKNLRDLLLYPPAGPHRVLGIDPAPRGQIPVACVDERGQPLDHDRLRFFDKDPERVAAARERIVQLVRTHAPQIVALGNGAGRRECEGFLRACFEELGDEAPVILVVNETAVGSYGGGPVGRSELPVLPVPVRAAVSLARRVMDPLPELVKVDPKQIGVGQYQNDVDPQRLRRALDETVEHCVNLVGVDLNRAPVQQLAAVCGLNTSLARSLVEQREKHGPYRSLQHLRELPFVPDRAFEQAGGFLRIHGGEDALDATGLHPSHAPLVRLIAGRCGVEPGALIGNTDLLAGLDVEAFQAEGFGPVAVASIRVRASRSPATPRRCATLRN